MNQDEPTLDNGMHMHDGAPAVLVADRRMGHGLQGFISSINRASGGVTERIARRDGCRNYSRDESKCTDVARRPEIRVRTSFFIRKAYVIMQPSPQGGRD